MHAAAGLLLGCTMLLPGSARRAQPKPAFADLERRTFELVNQQRRGHGLGELKWNDRLAEEVRRHAINMAGRRFFSHVDPVRGDLAARLKEDKIPWHDCAENLFEEQGYQDPAQQAVENWLKSPGHRRNMLNPNVSESGIGIAVRGDGTYLFVQIFIRP